jgi:glycosyltransferase involved in cell wall biosynthesis
MSTFSLPNRIKPHLFLNKQFIDLTETEITTLKERLNNLRNDTPDVTIAIPAWNEENNIYRTLSSLSQCKTDYKVEIIVINNNSSDGTQRVLEKLGIRNYFQEVQGTPHARQMGLEKAKGKFYLCADADTFYPPHWVDLMVDPMVKDSDVTGVYGRYSFVPPSGQGRVGLWFYELLTEIIIRIRQNRREHLNVYGFNMGFVSEIGLVTGGFNVKGSRVYAGVIGNDTTNDAEDGRMARNLKTKGRLQLVTDPAARVFTSPRRLLDDGSIWNAFLKRSKRQLVTLPEYFLGKKTVQ